MIGRYMGKTPKRGKSYAWVPNYVQDANGEITVHSVHSSIWTVIYEQN
jgi:hypothetical protein